MAAINVMTREEDICFNAALEQWKASLRRPDLSEEDRVRGALLTYQRQAFVFTIEPKN